MAQTASERKKAKWHQNRERLAAERRHRQLTDPEWADKRRKACRDYIRRKRAAELAARTRWVASALAIVVRADKPSWVQVLYGDGRLQNVSGPTSKKSPDCLNEGDLVTVITHVRTLASKDTRRHTTYTARKAMSFTRAQAEAIYEALARYQQKI